MYHCLAYCLDPYYHEDFDIPELIEVIGFDVALNNSGDKYSNQIELLHYFNCSVALPMCRSPTNILYNILLILFIYNEIHVRCKHNDQQRTISVVTYLFAVLNGGEFMGTSRLNMLQASIVTAVINRIKILPR